MITVNPEELKAAEALLNTLYTLNAVDPDNTAGLNVVYATDNTSQATTDPTVVMSPYAHVRAALLFTLTRLANGDAARGEQLLAEATDTGDCVRLVLASQSEQWAQEDRANGVIGLLREAGHLELWCDETGNHAPDLEPSNYDLRMASAAVDEAGLLDFTGPDGRARSALALAAGAALAADDSTRLDTATGFGGALAYWTTRAAQVVSELGTPTGYEDDPHRLANQIRAGVPVELM